MNTKNYFVRENKTEQQFFCQLQVSNKFRKEMSAAEAELLVWMVDFLVHRTATLEQVCDVALVIDKRVQVINSKCAGGPYLTVTYSPLRPDESGFIRIERTSGRHQCVTLPIIDYQGEYGK